MDLVFSVSLKKQKSLDSLDLSERARFLFLFEHKSFNNSDVLFQLLKYQASIYSQKEKRPVIPIVVYHGSENWTVPKSFKEFLMNFCSPKECQSLYKNVLDFRYRLLNLKDLNVEELPQALSTRAILHLMKNIEVIRKNFDRNLVEKALNMAKNLTSKQKEEIIRRAIDYVHQCSDSFTWKVLKDIEDKTLKSGGRFVGALSYSLEKAKTEGLQEGLQKGREEGREEGMEKGIEKGMEKGLLTVVKNMLKQNVDIKMICQFTGVSKKKVLKISRS